MKSPSPWSVKGVEPEAREAAKLAARRAGMPIGTWLSNTIRTAAAEQLRSGGTAPRGDRSGADPSHYGAADPQPDPHRTSSYGAGHRPPAPTTEAVLESINRLAAKIEASERRTADTLEPLAEKVRDLSERIDEVKENKAIESAPMERALARMSERLDEMEDGPRGRSGSNDRRKQGFFSRLFSD